MKERPILMRGEMVRATLDETKTQTRRGVKAPDGTESIRSNFSDASLWVCEVPNDGRCYDIKCPYGKPGDRLWVKETHWRYGKWKPNGLTKKGKKAWAFVAMDNLVRYDEEIAERVKRGKSGWHKRPSIFMPRRLSRITLEIVAVRVERLNDISEADCYAEGIARPKSPNLGSDVTRRDNAIHAYRTLWESINGKGSLAKNPWVWVITFKRIRP